MLDIPSTAHDKPVAYWSFSIMLAGIQLCNCFRSCRAQNTLCCLIELERECFVCIQTFGFRCGSRKFV